MARHLRNLEDPLAVPPTLAGTFLSESFHFCPERDLEIKISHHHNKRRTSQWLWWGLLAHPFRLCWLTAMMVQIQPKGRPDLTMTGPSSGGTQEAGGEREDKDITVASDGTPDLQTNHLMSGQVIQREATSLIADATIGYIKWNVKNELRHGYFNMRPVNEKEVFKLKAEMERSDDRYQHPLHAAVDLLQIESLDIHPSKDTIDAPALTANQVTTLNIVGIAGQHRLAAAGGILTGAEATLAIHRAKLQELEDELDANGSLGSVGAGGSQSTQKSSMGATGDSGVTSDNGIDDSDPQSWTLKDVPEIRKRLEAEQASVTYLSLWPMLLVDKGERQPLVALVQVLRM